MIMKVTSPGCSTGDWAQLGEHLGVVFAVGLKSRCREQEQRVSEGVQGPLALQACRGVSVMLWLHRPHRLAHGHGCTKLFSTSTPAAGLKAPEDAVPAGLCQSMARHGLPARGYFHCT